MILTIALDKTIKNSSKELAENIISSVGHYKQEYEKCQKPSEEKATIFQNFLQSEINKEDHSKVKCSKGCGFCCMVKVKITQDEAKLLIKHAKENNIEINKDSLEVQANNDGKKYFNLPNHQRRCQFMAEDNSCKVYDVRPMSCRKYHVITEPKLCDTYGVNNIGALINLNNEAIVSGIFNAVEAGYMPNMLLKELNQN